MITQTPETMVRDLNHMAEQLEHDVDRHEPVREILPEIRDMRRLLTTLEGELVDGMHSGSGDAC